METHTFNEASPQPHSHHTRGFIRDTCNVCGDHLVVGSNWASSHETNSHYFCRDCRTEYQRERRRRKREEAENATASGTPALPGAWARIDKALKQANREREAAEALRLQRALRAGQIVLTSAPPARPSLLDNTLVQFVAIMGVIFMVTGLINLAITVAKAVI